MQFEGAGQVTFEKLFHLLGNGFAVDLEIDLVVANGTKAVKVGSADG